MHTKLRHLLGSYDFIRDALTDHRERLAPMQVAELERSLDQAFLDILNYESVDIRVTLIQVRFLMTQLVGMAQDRTASEALRDSCQVHLNRLAQLALPEPHPIERPVLTESAYLDSLSDRVAILDTEYRYLFTNRANALFHGEDAQDFLGRPSWLVTGEEFFARVNKSRFDMCLAGRSVSYISAHPTGDPSKLYLVNIDPVKVGNLPIRSFMVSCRDISHLPIPDELIIPTE